MIDAIPENLLRKAGSQPTQVITTTLLPSGALASVTVCPRPNGAFSVSDDQAGWNDLLALGHDELTGGDTRRGKAIAERLGLLFDGKGFFLQEVTADQLTGAIVFIAEAAREWATSAAENSTRRIEVALTRRVEDRIRSILPKARIAREAELTGASTKKHKFDLVVELSEERKAVFEVVAPNANSLSSTHLKLFDLMGAHPDWPREAVTEHLEDWAAADMTLLAGVATHVRGMDRDWRDLPELTP